MSATYQDVCASQQVQVHAAQEVDMAFIEASIYVKTTQLLDGLTVISHFLTHLSRFLKFKLTLFTAFLTLLFSTGQNKDVSSTYR